MEKNGKVYGAIAALTNNAEWNWIGNDYADIEWITKGVKVPTEAEIEAKIADMETEALAKKETINAKLAALGLSAEELSIILA
jgi:HKD family nuclease